MVLNPRAGSGLLFPQQATGNLITTSRPPKLKRAGGLNKPGT